MKVYLVVLHVDYEGYSHNDETKVFATESAAEAYKAELEAACNHSDFSYVVFAYDLSLSVGHVPPIPVPTPNICRRVRREYAAAPETNLSKGFTTRAK